MHIFAVVGKTAQNHFHDQIWPATIIKDTLATSHMHVANVQNNFTLPGSLPPTTIRCTTGEGITPVRLKAAAGTLQNSIRQRSMPKNTFTNAAYQIVRKPPLFAKLVWKNTSVKNMSQFLCCKKQINDGVQCTCLFIKMRGLGQIGISSCQHGQEQTARSRYGLGDYPAGC